MKYRKPVAKTLFLFVLICLGLSIGLGFMEGDWRIPIGFYVFIAFLNLVIQGIREDASVIENLISYLSWPIIYLSLLFEQTWDKFIDS